APGAEVALVAPRGGGVSVVLAAPVGAADMRPVPHVGGVPGAQQLHLVAFAAIPGPLPDRGARTVPQEHRRRLGIDRDLVLHMAMIASERGGGRIAEIAAAGLKRALPGDRHRPL